MSSRPKRPSEHADEEEKEEESAVIVSDWQSAEYEAAEASGCKLKRQKASIKTELDVFSHTQG